MHFRLHPESILLLFPTHVNLFVIPYRVLRVFGVLVNICFKAFSHAPAKWSYLHTQCWSLFRVCFYAPHPWAQSVFSRRICISRSFSSKCVWQTTCNFTCRMHQLVPRSHTAFHLIRLPTISYVLHYKYSTCGVFIIRKSIPRNPCTIRHISHLKISSSWLGTYLPRRRTPRCWIN